MKALKRGGIVAAGIAVAFVLSTCGGAEELFQSVEERVAEAGAADLGVPEIEVRQAGTVVGSQFDFGAETVDQSKSLDFQIWNVGTGTLNLSGSEYVQILGSGFDCTQPSASGIPAGESVGFSVTFSPTVAESYEATMSIESNSVSSAELTIELVGTGSDMERLADVTSSVAEGTYHATQTVTLSHAESDVTIYYDVHAHGGNPTFSEYPTGDSIAIDQNQEISAYARKDGYLDSNTARFTYTLKPVTPAITLPDGAIGPPPQTVTIETTTGSTTIYYTIDGSEPDEFDTEYPDEPSGHAANGAPGVQLSVEETTFAVSARAYRSGWDRSDVAGPVSVEVTGTLTTPTIEWTNPDNPESPIFIQQGRTIDFSSPDSGVTLRYTLDGSTPTSGSPSGSSVTIDGYRTIVSVRAFKDNWNPSSTATQEFRIPIYETHSVTLDGPGRYNSALDKFFGTTEHSNGGFPPSWETWMHRYSAATGVEEAVDSTIPSGQWVFNDGNIVFNDQISGTMTEYYFTGDSVTATGVSGDELVARTQEYVEGDGYLYYVGCAAASGSRYEYVNLYSKTTLDWVANRAYSGVGETWAAADFGGAGSGYLFVGDPGTTEIHRLNPTCTSETTFSVSGNPYDIQVLNGPEGTYVFVRMSDFSRIEIYDETGTALATLPDLGAFAGKTATYPQSLIGENPGDANEMHFYRINTDTD